jgi:hypothetical protein
MKINYKNAKMTATKVIKNSKQIFPFTGISVINANQGLKTFFLARMGLIFITASNAIARLRL